MNTVYADDALLRATENLEAEGDLIQYLSDIGSGERWIYTESARICTACEIAAKLLVAKNQQIALLTAERAKWESITERGIKHAYANGRRSMAQELRHAAERGEGDADE